MTMTDPAPAPSAPEPPVTPRRRRRLGVAVGAGTLLLGSLAVGGIAVAEQDRGSTSSTGTATAPTRQWQGYGGPQGLAPGTAQGGLGGPQVQQQTQNQQSTSQTTSDASASQASGLVFISSTLTDGEARGTGMVLTSDGEVVTNHHVVAGATRIEVTVAATGRTYTARYVGGDATKDVAVLQLADASGLTTVDLASTAATTGDAITSVGDANGDRGTLTASPGTVTGTGESITVSDDDGTQHRLTGLVRLDADIVSGDSGGAVRTSSGEVVGMNVAASSGSATVTGYAIPIATVTSVVDQITAGQDTGEITLGYSGYLGVGISSGAVVAEVEQGSAADDAGLVAGDTITSVAGSAVTSGDALRSLIASHAAGDRVTIGWTTADGAQRSATATLGSIVG